MYHPAYLLHQQHGYGTNEDETAFDFDLKRAFKSLASLPEAVVHSAEQAEADIELLDDLNAIAERLNETAAEKTAGVDLETNCLRPYTANAKILSMAVSSRAGTFAFAVDHPQAGWTDLERKQLDKLIKNFLYDSRCRKIAHHLPFELEWFGYFYGTGCFYATDWGCSESQAYVIDPRRGGLSLDFLCVQYFGFNIKAISGLDRTNLEKVPLQQVLKYNGPDARYARLLYLAQTKRLSEENLQDVYAHQMRRIIALVLAQLHGVPVDQKVVAAFRDKYSDAAASAIADIEKDDAVKKFEKLKGRKFNQASTLDVNFLMREVLGIELETAGKEALNGVDHPIASHIIAWREANKVLSTYILPLDKTAEDSVVFQDDKLHPIISTTSTITWRTGASEPNIQNFPKHDDVRKEVRSQVRSPDPNLRIVSFDYAGIQARNVAMESKDKKLVEVFRTGYNVHADWRDRILKHYPKWIPKAKWKDEKTLAHYRQIAKNKFVFATFFGAQSFTTSEGLGIPREICEDLRLEFFDEFPDIKKWHEAIDKFYYQHGYVTGLSGFRRYAPVSANERINTPIQSDESIIVMDAMNRLSELQDPRYQAMLMVHDDLTFLWPKNEIEKCAEVVIKTMLACPFEWANIVPLGVEMSVGQDWINMQKGGEYMNDKWDGLVQLKNLV